MKKHRHVLPLLPAPHRLNPREDFLLLWTRLSGEFPAALFIVWKETSGESLDPILLSYSVGHAWKWLMCCEGGHPFSMCLGQNGIVGWRWMRWRLVFCCPSKPRMIILPSPSSASITHMTKLDWKQLTVLNLLILFCREQTTSEADSVQGCWITYSSGSV